MNVALVVIGVGAVAGLVRAAGSVQTARVLASAARWLPLLLVLEGARILVEAAATRSLYGERASSVPMIAFLRAELAGYAVTNTLPAGRAVSEAVKTGMLARYVGVSLGAAVGTAGQSMSLLATAMVSIPCAGAALWYGGSWAMAVAIGVHALVTGAAGIGIPLGARHPSLRRRLVRYPRLARALSDYQRTLSDHRILPARPFAGFVASRLLQVAQMGVLVAAVGGESGFLPAFLAQGVSFVGTTAGDLVPAQLGVTDAAFALSARLLRISRIDSLALALLGHVTLLIWVGVAALVPLALGDRARSPNRRAAAARWSSQPGTLGHP